MGTMEALHERPSLPSSPPLRSSPLFQPDNGTKSHAELLEDLAEQGNGLERASTGESSLLSPVVATGSSGGWLDLAGPIGTLLNAMSSRRGSTDSSSGVAGRPTPPPSPSKQLQHPRPHISDSNKVGVGNGQSNPARSRSPRLIGKLSDLGRLTRLESDPGAADSLHHIASTPAFLKPFPPDSCDGTRLATLEVAVGSGDVVSIDSLGEFLAEPSRNRKIWDLFPGLAPEAAGKWNPLSIDRSKFFLLKVKSQPVLPCLLEVTFRTAETCSVECTVFRSVDATFTIAKDGTTRVPDAGKPVLGRSGMVQVGEVWPELARLFGSGDGARPNSVPSSPNKRRPVSPPRTITTEPHASPQPSEVVFEGATRVAHPDGFLDVNLTVRKHADGTVSAHLAFHLPTPPLPISNSTSDSNPAQIYHIPGPTRSTSIRISTDPGISGGHGHVRRGWLRRGEEERQAVLKFVERSKLPSSRLARFEGEGGEAEVPVEIVVLLTLRKDAGYPDTLPELMAWGETGTHYWLAMAPLAPFSSAPVAQRNPYGLKIAEPSPPAATMDLFELIEWFSARHLVVPESAARGIFRSVAEALAFLHARGVVHRDIKDENVIVSVPGFTAQLADFGSAAFYPPALPDGRFDTFSGTLDFAPPEILKGIPYEGPPQDIWSLGCLLFTLWTGENPFKTPREAMLWDGDLDGLCAMGRRRRKVDESVKEVLGGCLEVDSGKRWTCERVFGSEWVSRV